LFGLTFNPSPPERKRKVLRMLKKQKPENPWLKYNLKRRRLFEK